MSIDKSLVIKGKLTGKRSVLSRAERIKILKEEGRWKEGES
ncbi:MAG: small basic protein, partial [Candidatus Brocadiales bacterium]